MVKQNKTLSIDHEVLGRFIAVVGHRHESQYVEDYMRSVADEYDKMKSMTNGSKETKGSFFVAGLSPSSSVLMPEPESAEQELSESEKILIGLLNLPKMEITKFVVQSEDYRLVKKVQRIGSQMLTLADTWFQKRKAIPEMAGRIKITPKIEAELQELKKDLKLPEYCSESEVIQAILTILKRKKYDLIH